MSKLKTNTIQHTGGSADNITLDNSQNVTAEGNLTVDGNLTVSGTSTISGYHPTTSRSNRNLIINGAMNISQRHGSTSTNIAAGGTAHAYVLDRWQVSNSDGGGTFAVQQVEDGPAGFNYSNKVTTSVVDDGGANSFCVVQQRIEGYNGNQLEFGTSDAKTVTISFWVKSSLTGTFGASLVAGNYDKMYVFQYTISSADTWEKKTVTIAGPTSGGTYYKTNGRYCVLYFDLGSGSNAEASAANNWAATGTWTYGHRIAGNQKVSTNVNATWQITGVQLEVGSVATDFEHRSYGDELKLCERYCETLISGANKYMTNSVGYTTNQTYAIVRFRTAKRATPSLVQTTGTDYYIQYTNASSSTASGFTGLSWENEYGAALYNSMTITAGHAGLIGAHKAAAKILITAEL